MSATIAPLSVQMLRALEPAVSPVAPAQPVTIEFRTGPSRPQHSAAAVAFAPAAMSALIEAQKHLAHGAAPLVRDQSMHAIDRLMARMPQPEPLAARMLTVARDRLRDCAKPNVAEVTA